MQHLLGSVRSAVREKNWYAALSVALALPDICAKLEDPSQNGSQKRYVAWFDRNLGDRYQRLVGGEPHTFLTGEDCYALRCAYLHQGDFEIAGQRARAVLDSFVFVSTSPGTVVHLNQASTRLQLQVDIFCEEICAAVEAWMSGVGGTPDVRTRVAALPQVTPWGPGAQF